MTCLKRTLLQIKTRISLMKIYMGLILICPTKLNRIFMLYFFPAIQKGLEIYGQNLQPTAAEEVHFIYFLKN